MKPLQGVRVVDFTQVFAGPFCTYQLALLGAEVIKIEAPGVGDVLRGYAHGSGDPQGGMGGSFISINGGKKSVAVNLKSPAGREVLKGLIADADVVVENFRNGVMDRNGLSWEACKAVNPRLIYATLSGFGATGPYKDWPAFDHTMQAMTGMMSLNGEPGEPPMKVGFPVIDGFTGYVAAFAIMAALRQRDATGEGQFVDVAMFDASMVLMTSMVAPYLNAGRQPERLGSRGYSGSPTSDLFRAGGDSHISLGANNQGQYELLCKAIGAPQLIADPRFATHAARVEHDVDLRSELEAIFATADAEVWEQKINAAGVPASKLRTVFEATGLPYLEERGLMIHTKMSQKDDRDIKVLNTGFRTDWSGIDAPPPLLGQHTEEVLLGLGRTSDEIAALRQEGAIG
jgi:crotonobetainyl-CoA:carnitine CoA-transferase CaiB-like acyl-CoA transferase